MSTQPFSREPFAVGLCALVAWCLAPAAALAQPSFNVTFGGTLDSFAQVTTPTESRQNLAGGVNLEHRFADERGRVFYDMDGGDYDSAGDWSYYQHNLGTTYRFGGKGTTDRKLFLNGSVVKRTNGDAWTNAAFAGVGAGVNAEFHPCEQSTLRAGYRADYRRFADYAPLTQLEQRVFGSGLRSFESRTTLVGEVQAGFKVYDGSTVTELPATETVVTTGGGRGSGPGMGSNIRVVTRPVYVMSAEEGSAGLVSGMVRVAQSLTDRIGAHGQAQVRRTFGSVPPALVTTPAGFFEDGVYDDPFASNALFLQAGLKRSFAGGAELSGTAWWADKNYTGVVALDGDGMSRSGDPLRTDRVTQGQVMWSQPLFATKTGGVGLTADVGYRYLRHRSNDAFYNYTSHALAVGLSVGY